MSSPVACCGTSRSQVTKSTPTSALTTLPLLYDHGQGSAALILCVCMFLYFSLIFSQKPATFQSYLVEPMSHVASLLLKSGKEPERYSPTETNVRWVMSGINHKLLFCCLGTYIFYSYLQGHHLLKQIKPVSAFNMCQKLALKANCKFQVPVS